MTQDEILTNKIKAQNDIHAFLKKLQPFLIEWLTPFLGEKIIKADRSFMKKVKDLQPALKENEIRWYIDTTSNYSLRVKADKTAIVSIHQGGGHSVDYRKANHCICDIDNGVITKINVYPIDLRTDFTLEEIKETRKKVSELRTQISNYNNSIYPFNEGR